MTGRERSAGAKRATRCRQLGVLVRSNPTARAAAAIAAPKSGALWKQLCA